MRQLLIAAGLLVISGFSSAKGVTFEVTALPLPQALNLLYAQVFDKPFMIAPELADDKRVVTFRITPDIDERAFIKRYLGNMNIAVYPRNGIDYIAPFEPKKPVIPRETYVYQPKWCPVNSI